jgi:hypothetical protein
MLFSSCSHQVENKRSKPVEEEVYYFDVERTETDRLLEQTVSKIRYQKVDIISYHWLPKCSLD